MSEKYKDFLEEMLKIAKKWGWTNNKKLSKINMEYSKRLGINASPQYEFGISIKGLKDIYHLSGPLINSHKDKCINFHIKRSNSYINIGAKNRANKTKEKILEALKNDKDLITTTLQFIVGVGIDVILDHLHDLEKKDLIKKERKGKRYIWNIK